MHFQWLRHIKRHRRECLRLPLVIVVCCSLIMMGTLFWIDNSWALLFDNDPQTVVELGDYLFDGSSLLDDDDGLVSIVGGPLIRGNGDQDDNKEESFFLVPRAGRIAGPQRSSSARGFESRHITLAYEEFGHLRVMPAEGDMAGIIAKVF